MRCEQRLGETADGSAHAPVDPSNPRNVVDLFCGAGGLSLGFLRAGYRVSLAIDHFRPAAATYRFNIGAHVVCDEITEVTELPPAAVITGGPPCQGFSSAGQRRAGDNRNTLVSVFARLVARARPRAFLFENVEGFLTAEGGDRVFDLLEPLVAAGYRIHLRKINAANFGVPQHRKRVIGIGGLGWDPSFPEPTHAAYGAPGARGGRHLPPTLTLSDALKGLPPAPPNPPGDPAGHFHLPLEEHDLDRIQRLDPGQTMRDLPRTLWHDSYQRRAFRRVMDGTPTERRGGAPAGIRRLRFEEPSKAITSGARSEFVHPTEHRYLTIRECARIQTFPDSFKFAGASSEQALLIGNAVPPALAEVLARALATELSLLDQAEATKPGALLSFVPTAATGMSPLLQEVSDRVRATFSPKIWEEEQTAFAWH